MNPDDLDDLVTRSLCGAAASPGSTDALGSIVRRGRARRRRRTAIAASGAAVVVFVAAGLAVLAGRGTETQRVTVGERPSTVEPTTAATTRASVATTPAPLVSSVVTTIGSAAARGPDFVVVDHGLLDVYRGGASIAHVNPCGAEQGAAQCTTPVIATAGTGLVYLRRTAGGTTIVQNALDGSAETTVAGAADAADLAVGSNGYLYVLDGQAAATPGQLRVVIASGAALRPNLRVALNAYEVVATEDGRLAWVTDDGITVRRPDGTDRVIGLGRFTGAGDPSQLSFGPSGSSLLLVRAPGDAGTRLVVDTARDNGLDDARVVPATAACWTPDGTIAAFDGSVTTPGSLRRVDAATGSSAPITDQTFATAQIACAADGTIALVDHSGGAATGDLVLVRADGSVSRLGGGYERVRSIR